MTVQRKWRKNEHVCHAHFGTFRFGYGSWSSVQEIASQKGDIPRGWVSGNEQQSTGLDAPSVSCACTNCKPAGSSVVLQAELWVSSSRLVIILPGVLRSRRPEEWLSDGGRSANAAVDREGSVA